MEALLRASLFLSRLELASTQKDRSRLSQNSGHFPRRQPQRGPHPHIHEPRKPLPVDRLGTCLQRVRRRRSRIRPAARAVGTKRVADAGPDDRFGEARGRVHGLWRRVRRSRLHPARVRNGTLFNEDQTSLIGRR